MFAWWKDNQPREKTIDDSILIRQRKERIEGTIWYNLVQYGTTLQSKHCQRHNEARCLLPKVSCVEYLTEYFNFTGYFYSIYKFLFLIWISSSSCQYLDNFEEKTTFTTGYGLLHKKMIHTKPTRMIFSTITISLV